jgi:catechol 2,3-dioxygenase-like lactoylglutathione lyase family enzyme
MEINGTITFFYYKDLTKAAEFYEEKLGFERVIDIDLAKVFRVHDNVHVGLVDGNIGYLKYNESKPVMLSWFSDDIHGWYKHLKEKGVEIEHAPVKQAYLEMKTMLFRDPEGYLLEILQWLKKPYGK